MDRRGDVRDVRSQWKAPDLDLLRRAERQRDVAASSGDPEPQQKYEDRYRPDINPAGASDHVLTSHQVKNREMFFRVDTYLKNDKKLVSFEKTKKYAMYYNPHDGVDDGGTLVVSYAYRTHDKRLGGKGAMSLSGILRKQMQDVAEKAGTDPNNPPLEKVIIHHMNNDQTQDVLNPLLVGHEHRTFSPQDRDFESVKKTPLVKSINHLLADHYGNLEVRQIEAWHPPGYNMAIHLIMKLGKRGSATDQ